MNKSDKETILSYLSYAYKQYMRQLKVERETLNKDFSITSIDYKVAQAQYNQMSCLARDLGLSNPYETFEMNIDIIED